MEVCLRHGKLGCAFRPSCHISKSILNPESRKEVKRHTKQPEPACPGRHLHKRIGAEPVVRDKVLGVHAPLDRLHVVLADQAVRRELRLEHPAAAGADIDGMHEVHGHSRCLPRTGARRSAVFRKCDMRRAAKACIYRVRVSNKWT